PNEDLVNVPSAGSRGEQGITSSGECRPWQDWLWRALTHTRGSANPSASLRLAQILKQIKPALSRANQINIPVAVDVDGSHPQSGPRRARREILECQAFFPLRGRILGRLAMKNHVLGPGVSLRVPVIPRDGGRVGIAWLDLMGIDSLARHQFRRFTVA